MIYPVYFLLFGVFLTGLLGLVASWVDRKVTARVQYRVGPPLLQPFWDLVKLAGKETVVPEEASIAVFLAAPLAGLSATLLVSTILWVHVLGSSEGFLGDWVVVLYLLLIPPISLIMGGFASRNPLASVGASREMQVMMAYELPFLLAALVPVIKTGGTLSLSSILATQAETGPFAASPSGFLALLVGLLCVQAKLSLVPFDISEAETEISGGVLIEYSGPPLAIFRLTRNMLLFALPFFLMVLLLGGISLHGFGPLIGALKYVVLLSLIIVMRNTNPRLRIDQALRFFWGPLLLTGILAVVLAVLGY